jgi:RNA 3'-terminal phosphate cyclase (ATP)
MAPAVDTAVHIDGGKGEGGGQILRTALTLSACLGRPLHIVNIRAQRKRPGLQPQHLAAVQAAASICRAAVEGAVKDSQELRFEPSQVMAGSYHFSVGTAGSTTLVLQTVLPALLLAEQPSQLVIEGGTHNPLAPPFDFLQHAFLPLLNRMGPTVTARLERPGFAPRGGGRLHVAVQPATRLRPLAITERGVVRSQHAEVLLAHLPEPIARRELAVLQRQLGYDDSQLRFRWANDAYGPGNVVNAIIESEHVTECFSAFGQRGLPAEVVAQQVVDQVRRYLQAGVPVGLHLADQLLLPLVLAGGGTFVTLQPSSHTLTNIDIIRAFVGVDIQTREIADDVWKVSVA